MFTRLLVGLDGSPRADVALEQAIVLGKRFGSTIVLVHARDGGPVDGATLLDRGRERLAADGLEGEVVEQNGPADEVLAVAAEGADAVLVGRRGLTATNPLGRSVTALIRRAERCVIVCAGQATAMRSCAIAYDGRDASRHALDLAVRFASIMGATVHVIHAADARDAGLQVVGMAEAALSMQRVAFTTHVEPGQPGEVIAAVIARVGCDALFAGAHLELPGRGMPAVLVSHAEEILRHAVIPVVIQP
ncbi:MAG TPA: universal stress protein [Gemmatimonadales bacterium]|nr:universal stress protein [Gemmatimonadales bacterium]